MQLLKHKSWLNSKSFWGSLLFAIALWGYTALNSEYQTSIDIPLLIKLPQSRALESIPYKNVSVYVRGTGWNLFNLIFFNSSKSCLLDLSKENIIDSIYRINRTDLQKNLQFISNVTPINVLPENIILKTGEVIDYEVYVNPKVVLIPREGFTLVGRTIIEPEKIKLRGNKRIVEQINRWNTATLIYEGINSDFHASIPLIDTLPGVVDVYPKYVSMKINVQQIGEVVLYDIPITVSGGSLPYGHKLEPPLLTVILQGGVNELENLSSADISATIDFDKLISDSTGIMKAIIKLPPNISLLRTEPRYIYHKVVEDFKSLTETK